MMVERVRERLGRFGVWIPPYVLGATSVEVQRRELVRIERLGYGSIWTGETPVASSMRSREAFAQLGLMLAATERIVVGAGIANIGNRAATAMHTGAATLAEAYPGRFVLGLGGHSGERPLGMLREYLDAMARPADTANQLADYPLVLAALGPRAHELARERAHGVHPFLQPVAHTAAARAAVGPGSLVIPHQSVVLETDPDTARSRLRAIFDAGVGAAHSPYARHYLRLGYSEADVLGRRSDRLIDDLLAWGDEAAVAARLTAQLDAGADHVLVHPFAADLPAAVDQLERLAPLLVGAAY